MLKVAEYLDNNFEQIRETTYIDNGGVYGAKR
jgi:hypothetical protein